MNRTLPPGDRGRRSGAAGRQSRCRRIVLGACRLVGGVEHPRRRETPPDGNPAAPIDGIGCGSGFDGIATLAILGACGSDGQAHLRAYDARKKSAKGMWLPAGGFQQFLGGCAARPLEQVEDLGGLATVAGGSGFLRAFGRFLGRAGLLPRLPLLRGHVPAKCASVGLFGGFRVGSGRALGWLRFFRGRCGHVFSLCGDYRSHHIDHSVSNRMQAHSEANSERRLNGDEATTGRQMGADGRRW
jgi:hypothetical protein